MKGKILSIPLRLKEVLGVGSQLIDTKNGYTTDDKINFLKGMKTSYKKYNTAKSSVEDAAMALFLVDYPLSEVLFTENIFKFLKHMLVTAKNNDIRNFNIYSLIDKHGNNILHAAVQKERYFFVMIALILSPSEFINSQNNAGFTPLYLAVVNLIFITVGNIIKAPELAQGSYAQERSLEIIKKLFQHNANPNIPDKQGNTPLHLTARQHLLDPSRILIEHGADIDAKNNEGKTPADLWPEIKGIESPQEQLKLVQDFLDKKRFISMNVLKMARNAKNALGETAIMMIATEFFKIDEINKKELFKLIEILLDAHADINAKDDGGNTALIIAVRTGDPELVRFLLDHGARADLIGFLGKTARQTAVDELVHPHTPEVQVAYLEIIQMLEEAEKNQPSKMEIK